MSGEEKVAVKAMRKQRTVNNLWVLLVLVVALGVFRYSDDVLRWADPQAAALGVDILQPAIVSIVYVCIGSVFATIMAAFYESQLKENSFGTWSRFGLLFLAFFLGFVAVSGAIL